MSNDVSITFGSDADKLARSMNDLNASLLALGSSFEQAADKSKKLDDGLSDLEKAAKKQAQAWAVFTQGVNASFEIIKKGMAGLQQSYAFLREGADIAKAGQTFKAFTRSIGKDSETMMLALRKATRNQVSDLELMQSAITAMKTGVTTDTAELSKLFEIANAKADLFGLSLVESFNTITRAIATGKKEAFVSLDLIPRSLLDASNSADLLKNRTQLLYEVLRHGEKDVKTLSQAGAASADSFAQLETSIKNLSDSVKKDLSGSLMPLVEYVRTDAVPTVKSTFDLLGSSIVTLKDINDATGLLNATLAATTGYVAGMAIGKMVVAFDQLSKAIKAAAVAQGSLNIALSANPYGMALVATALSVYAAKVKYDEWQANEYAAQKNAELAAQNVAGQARAELVQLEDQLRQLKSESAQVETDIKNKSREWAKFQESRVATPVFGKDENDKFADSIEKLAAKQAEYKTEITKAEEALASVRDRLKEIVGEQQKIFDNKALMSWSNELAGMSSETLADRMMGFSIGGLYSGSFAESKQRQDAARAVAADKEAERVLKRLEDIRKQTDTTFAEVFGAVKIDLKQSIELMHKAGMAAMGFANGLDQLNPELGKFLDEMKALSDSDARISAVGDVLRDISNLDFSEQVKAIGFLSDIPATVSTLAMMNQMSGGLMAAPGVAPVKQESAAAQMIYAASGGLIGNYGRNVFEQQFKTRFADVQNAAKDVRSEFSNAIADAITEGFSRADFSGFPNSLGSGLSGVVGGIMTDTIQSAFSKKNTGVFAEGKSIFGDLFKPVRTKNAAGDMSLNWGNLGHNLAVGGAFSFLTSPGRLFGGRVVKGQENFDTSASLNDQVNQAKDLRDQLYLQAGISEVTRQLLDEAEFYYTWVRKTKSGNGITSKKTTTYLLEGSGQAQASIDNIKSLQEAVMGEQATRSYQLWQISRNDDLRALQLSAGDAESAYYASLATNANSPEVQALRVQQEQYKAALATVQSQKAAQAIAQKQQAALQKNNNATNQYPAWSALATNQYPAWSALATNQYPAWSALNNSTYKDNQISMYQTRIQDLQAQIDASSGYKYSEVERTNALRAYEQAKVDLLVAKESARSNLFSSFSGDVNLAALVGAGSAQDTRSLYSMLLGDTSTSSNSQMIKMMLPLLEQAGYQGYDIAKAFNEAGSDPDKQLEAYKQQQKVFEGALSTYEKLAADARAESLNTSLSVEAQAASFERWQEAFDAFLHVQEQIEQNTRTIADIEKQNLLNNIVDKISDALTIVGEFINQKGGDRLITYRQPMTKDELLSLLKEAYATKDPEKYSIIQEIIDDTGDLAIWGG